MRKCFFHILILIAFTSCHGLKKIVAGKDVALPGDAHIVYTYTDDNRRPADTFVVSGLGHYVYSYAGNGYQREFILPVCDKVKKDTVKRKLETWHIVYAKIRSLDGKDSIEYTHNKGETYRVVKRRNNMQLLYRTYDYYSSSYDASSGTISVTGVFDDVILLKNGKKVKGADLTFDKRWLVKKFINKRYNQNFKKKDFKDINQVTDYIMDKENEKED